MTQEQIKEALEAIRQKMVDKMPEFYTQTGTKKHREWVGYGNAITAFDNAVLDLGANFALDNRWVKFEGQQIEAGEYWIFVDGKVQTATVNEEEYADMCGEKGFWQYSDSSRDIQVFPTHYLPYTIPQPPKS